MARNFIFCALAVVFTILEAGCVQRPSVVSESGTTAVRFLTPTSTASEHKNFGDMAVPPEPILPLTLPIYPPNARAAKAGLVFVGIRIVVDKTGHVSAIDPSPLAISSSSPFAADFQKAIREAVANWRFEPAFVQRTEAGKSENGSDEIVFKGVEKIEWSFDISFTFTAAGSVLSGYR
ncbi:MAG TPA: hypothetical protein VGM64_20815 [Lacunisphaera sp.]|jgi:hypothetical protein